MTGFDAEDSHPVEICKRCGKRVGTGRQGSLTQVSIGGDITVQVLRRLKKAHPKIKYSAVDEYNIAFQI